ncbi:MAG: hypothetical protein AMS16_00435 [Planctomycetes bacterium DG_58]|nr:MAG: hypothetical protein AMS16_00435 [Planctomycetes bacterium DG_58]
MPTDPWLNYLVIGAAIVAVVVAAILVRRARPRSGGDHGGASRILERGWQFYFAPTTLEPPGTLFRIDADHRRYIVETLLVEAQVGEEAFGEYTESVTAGLGILARFLGLKGINVNASTAKTEQLVFKLDKPEREVVNDLDLDKVLRPFLKDLDYRVDNRYFVIRECRKATGITHHLTQSQVDDLGGEATLADRLALEGTLFKSERRGEFLLEKNFDQPMRVMFLPEEIKPVGASLARARPELGLVPVSETLIWEEG